MKNKTSRASLGDARFCINGLNKHNILDKIILAALMAIVFLFIMYPLLCIVKQSIMGDGVFSFTAYESIFDKNLHLLKNSVFVALLSAVLSTVLATAAAFSVRFTFKGLSKALMGILLISMVSPPFISQGVVGDGDGDDADAVDDAVDGVGVDMD